MQSQREYVLRTVEERGVRFIQLWFTDVLGTPKSFSITPAELENALEGGMTFDGSSIDGFSRVQESDVLAKPDPKTFQILPFRIGREGDVSPVARVFCDITNLDGTPFEGCPGTCSGGLSSAPATAGFLSTPPRRSSTSTSRRANRVSAEAARLGLVLRADGGGPDHRPAQAHGTHPRGHGHPRRVRPARRCAEPARDRPPLYRCADDGRHGDDGPPHSQGDRPRERRSRQLHAQTALGRPGLWHAHALSLFEGDRNAFADRGSDHGLSEVGRQFIAGVLQHAREITAVTNQWVNSYKRLVVGYEAPVNVSWAYNNRSALVRVPIARRGKVESTRFEYRAPDPACNPYLAFSVVLAAGLEGIEKGYELGPEAAANLFTMTPEELASEGIRSLPSSLQEALVAMEGSELVAETLGEHVFEWFLRNKRAEWDAYTREVTPYELARYLPAL